MRNFAPLLVCMACVGHGRRAHILSEALDAASESLADVGGSSQRTSNAGDRDSLNAFAMLLLAHDPTVAFNFYSSGRRLSVADPQVARSRAVIADAHSGLDHNAGLSRRGALFGAAAGLLGAAASPPLAAIAKQDVKDLSRLKKGLEGVQFLLDNWDKETIDKITGDKSPDKVRFYLGLKTTDHPLFQVEKILAAANEVLPDDVDFDKWVDTCNELNTRITQVNELAYTSSFAEYNPGGGKDAVAKYLEQARAEVVKARDSLKTIVGVLKL